MLLMFVYEVVDRAHLPALNALQRTEGLFGIKWKILLLYCPYGSS